MGGVPSKEPDTGWEAWFSNASIGDVLAAMQQHLADATVSGEGCRALANLAGKCYAQAIGDSGGVEVLLAAMQQHLSDADVQKWGCDALNNLATYHPPNRRRAGGVAAAKAAMQQHPTNALVQLWGQDLLDVLLKAPTPSVSRPHTLTHTFSSRWAPCRPWCPHGNRIVSGRA
jgi:hypothetical protein